MPPFWSIDASVFIHGYYQIWWIYPFFNPWTLNYFCWFIHTTIIVNYDKYKAIIYSIYVTWINLLFIHGYYRIWWIYPSFYPWILFKLGGFIHTSIMVNYDEYDTIIYSIYPTFFIHGSKTDLSMDTTRLDGLIHHFIHG